MERLSSGLRINRASDDAAGLAISEKLASDARLYSTALRNINDGISVLNIVDSALDAQSQITTRLSELAEQAANGVYSIEQRKALSIEYRALVSELSRIGQTTEFNGLSLLEAGRGSGGFSELLIQAGIGSDSNSQIGISGLDTSIFSGTVGLFGNHDGSPDGLVDGSDFFDWNAFKSGIRTVDEISEFYQGGIGRLTVTDSNGETRNILFALGLYEYFGNDEAVIEFYEETSTPGLYQGGTNQFLSNFSGNVHQLTMGFTNGASASITLDFRALDIQSLNSGATVNKSALEFTGIESQNQAQAALDAIRNRQDELSSLRGQVGATLSRLSVASQMALAAREAFDAAASRIRDADIAFEVSELVRTQILQKAALAILAQANQTPQLALTLLTAPD